MGLERLLERAVRVGSLQLALPGGRRLSVGDGSGPDIAVRLTSRLWAARIAADPQLAVGEAYMAGALVMERGDIYGLIDLAGRNLPEGPVRPPGPFRRWRHDWLSARNARRQALSNVRRHYELPVEFYRRFLDEDLQYSCAYFARPGMSLEEAQAAKKRHLAAKLLLAPGQKVLDIGCGWGGLALSLAAAGAVVDGITLSEAQAGVARWRAEASGLAGRVNISVTDYRDARGLYDRIVSVGMFEHVGRLNYRAYFDQVARLLAPDGVAVIHSIGRFAGPGITQPWLARHIFPGGYIPALSEVLAAVERSALVVTDIEILRLHYAETLQAWRERFSRARPEVAAIRGERFCRMWEFYLAASEVGFRRAGHMVLQLQLARRQDAVPITRGYIEEAEQRLSQQQQRVA